jgi:hypothetical protein
MLSSTKPSSSAAFRASRSKTSLYDPLSEQYLHIPTKEWFTGMSQKLPLSQLSGPRSLTTYYHKSWVHEFLTFHRNLSLAFEWVPKELPKELKFRPPHRIHLPSLLGSENAKFNALLIGFFTYQIFTHLFRPHIFTSPIKEAFSCAQELSKEDTARGNTYKNFFTSLGASRIRDRTRNAARFRLWHELILPLVKQHPLHRNFRNRGRSREVFKGFFDWLFDGEAASIGKLKCYLLWAASSEMVEYLMHPVDSLRSANDPAGPSYSQQGRVTGPAHGQYNDKTVTPDRSRILYGSTTLRPCQATKPSFWIRNTATHEDIMGYWCTRHTTARYLTPLHPKIFIVPFGPHVTPFNCFVMGTWVEQYKARDEYQPADGGGSRNSKS